MLINRINGADRLTIHEETEREREHTREEAFYSFALLLLIIHKNNSTIEGLEVYFHTDSFEYVYMLVRKRQGLKQKSVTRYEYVYCI